MSVKAPPAGRKVKTVYSCTQCGAQAPKWMGQCADCGAWNSLVEDSAPVAVPASRHRGYAGDSGICTMAEVAADEEPRTPTGIAEVDRVLGGGMVAGSVVLIGGDPGIGKSTLLLQTLAALGSQTTSV